VTEKQENPQAFPLLVPVEFQYAQPGMSLRDWFAGQVAGGMAAFSGTAGVSYGPGDIAGRAYQIADAMLAAAKGEKP